MALGSHYKETTLTTKKSLTNRLELPTNPQEAFIGEIGLTGEIRRVTRIEQRINEAAKLGFTKIYAPKNSLHGMKIPEGIQVVGVTTVGEVLKKVFS